MTSAFSRSRYLNLSSKDVTNLQLSEQWKSADPKTLAIAIVPAPSAHDKQLLSTMRGQKVQSLGVKYVFLTTTLMKDTETCYLHFTMTFKPTGVLLYLHRRMVQRYRVIILCLRLHLRKRRVHPWSWSRRNDRVDQSNKILSMTFLKTKMARYLGNEILRCVNTVLRGCVITACHSKYPPQSLHFSPYQVQNIQLWIEIDGSHTTKSTSKNGKSNTSPSTPTSAN